MILGAVGIWLAGCTEEAERSPEKVRTGSYEVSVTTEQDSCSPKRLEGNVGVTDVAIPEDRSSISPMVPSSFIGGGVLGSFQRFNLPADADFALTVGPGLDAGTSCGGAVTFLTSYTLAEADESGMALRRHTKWSVTRPCDAGVVSEVPEASCEVEQVLRYELKTACDAPCQLRSDGLHEYHCACQ